MINILVVEDNNIIRAKIVNRIKKDVQNIDNIYQAVDGLDGYESILKYKPDLVLTDIEMPNEDAWYMIEKCTNEKLDTKFVIISGHDDFLNLKNSIKFSVVNYLLKPIDKEELIQVVYNAANDIMKTKTHNISLASDSNRIYLADFLNYKYGLETLRKNLIDTDADNKKFIVFSFNLVDDIMCSELAINDIFTLETNIKRYIKNCNCLISNTYKNIYSGILMFDEEISILDFKDIILNEVSKSTSSKVYLSFSNISSFHEILQNFSDTLYNLCLRFINEDERIFIKSNKKYRTTQEIDYLDIFNGNTSYEKIGEIIQDCILSNNINFIIDSIKKIAKNDNGDIIPEIQSARAEYVLLQFRSKAEIIQTFINLLNFNNNTTNNLIDNVIFYIKRNFTSPINLNTLSQEFNLNSVYLGQLLKKSVGKSFNTYINELRIEQAKIIIKENPNVLNKDLSKALGYSEPEYFAKVFKKFVGLSPKEYSFINDKN